MAEQYIKTSLRKKRFVAQYDRWTVDGTNSVHTDTSDYFDTGGSLVGVKNPRWKAQVKNGQNAGTQMSATRTRIDHKPFSAREFVTYTSGTPRPYYGKENLTYEDKFFTYPTPIISHSSLESKASNQALTNYLSRAEKARRVLLSGETIGEWGQLVRQISSPGKSLKRGLGAYVDTVRNRVTRRSVRRLPSARRSAEQLKIVGDTWLEYSFGWRPLISEVEASIDYFNEVDPTARYDVRNIKGVGVEEDSSWIGNSSGRTQVTHASPGMTVRQRQKVKVIVIYRGQVRMSNSSAGYLAEKVGFHPTQWVPTLWELIPYSFMIDYFSNIGDIISAVCFPTNRLAWSMKTTIVDKTGYFCDPEVIWSEPQSNCNYYACWTISRQLYSLGGASHRYSSVFRTPNVGSLIPDLEFSIPGMGTKWLNMAALFSDAKAVQKLLR